MTSMGVPFSFITSLFHSGKAAEADARRQIDKHRKCQTIMKTMAMGIMLAASFGPICLATVESDVFFDRNFSYSMVGGSIGAGICWLVFLVGDFQTMARHSAANLLLAVVLGPTATELFAHHMEYPITPRLIVIISTCIGVGGVFLLKAIGPQLIAMLSTSIPNAIRRFLGLPEAPKPPA